MSRKVIERPHRYQPTGWLQRRRVTLKREGKGAEVKSIEDELKHRRIEPWDQ